MARVTRLHVNGTVRSVDVEPERSLLSVLREDLDLTGSKYGCGEGECGACMVLVDGEAVPSCQTKVGEVDGKQIVTIEGLGHGGRLHPLQQAFLDTEAMQCGYCTPGMIISGVALLTKTPNPTDQEIVGHMQRNICRCGTYSRIISAIHEAAGGLVAPGKAGGVR
jgi:nicotinate dehydrogenase subunit A